MVANKNRIKKSLRLLSVAVLIVAGNFLLRENTFASGTQVGITIDNSTTGAFHFTNCVADFTAIGQPSTDGGGAWAGYNLIYSATQSSNGSAGSGGQESFSALANLSAWCGNANGTIAIASPVDGTTYYINLDSYLLGSPRNTTFAYGAVTYHTVGGWGGGSINTTPRIDYFFVHTDTQLVDVGGYMIGSSTASTTQRLVFYQTSSSLGQENTVTVNASSTGTFLYHFPFSSINFQINATSTSPTISSPLTLVGKIYQIYSNFDPFTNTGTTQTLLVATSTSIAASSTASVSSGSALSLSGLPDQPCSITQFSGCIKNAFVWLFYPTSDSIDQFSEISLQGKFPFAYMYQLGEIRSDLLSASSTAPLSLSVNLWKMPGHATSTLTLISRDMIAAVPFAGTINTILIGLIWLLTAEYIYYRVIRVHDTHTPQ